MEWIGTFFIAILVFSAVLQLVWAYSLSAIAEKTDQSALMSVLAWIPLLQLAPMLAAGGGSVGRFLLGGIALIVGNIVLGVAAAFLGEGLGSVMAGLGLSLTLLLCMFYFGRLFWNTAEARDLPGWVGLLLFVPLVNLFAYPYIAFHDGISRPNLVGLAIGVVLTFASLAPSFQIVNMMNAEGGFPTDLAGLAKLSQDPAFAELARQAENGDLGPGFQLGEPSALDGSGAADSGDLAAGDSASIHALFDLKSQFETLDQLITPENLKVQDRRLHALGALQSARTQLEANRGLLDAPTHSKLALHLVELEALLHDGHGRISTASARTRSARDAAQPNSASGPAAIGPSVTHSAPPVRPLPVHATGDCPEGTELRTQAGERGDEEWCQQLAQYGGLRHGWYAKYLEGGRAESVGEYRDGLRVGVWTRFHPSGAVRVQAEFEKGLQQGWLLSFDAEGRRTKAVRFEEGVPAP